MEKRINIFGASGSGTTTLAKALFKKLGIQHYDKDDYFWIQSNPPFQLIRKRVERQKHLNYILNNRNS